MSQQQPVLTVSRLTQDVRTLLETGIGRVWLQGEISGLLRAGSGHWYFTLMDNAAQVRCAMFRQRNARVRIPPKDGDQVLVQALVSLYEPRGEFQLVVEQMLPAGEGLLRAKFEALKAQLAAEGLFDANRKRPLPSTVRRVGVVTSATGAAIHDILTVLARRDPLMEVIIYPTLVQGNLASGQIVRAIETANARREVDVLIVGRGGGSAEDLWCFNEEPVVRALAASVLPTVSAVGHEVDVSLADLVADWRAPTPSAAAELISSDRSRERQQLQQLAQRATRALGERLGASSRLQQTLEERLQRQHPARRLEQQAQRLDELDKRQQRAMVQQLARGDQRLSHYQAQLKPQRLALRTTQATQILDQWQQRAHKAMRIALSAGQQRLESAAGALHLVSPLATLGRGYSITRLGEQGAVIRHPHDVRKGDRLTTRVAGGFIQSTVTDNGASPTPAQGNLLEGHPDVD